MSEIEGVIKYQLNHYQQMLPTNCDIKELNKCRTIFHCLNLIGQNPNRYSGYGFGNISQRQANCSQFLISGTQTGHKSQLEMCDYSLVISANLQQNKIQSQGLSQPSSEALTHAMVYQQNTAITAVIHIHSPEIWKKTQNLKIPYTAKHIPYGTPEMAIAVEQLFQQTDFQTSGIFSLLGHEDGIICFAENLQHATKILIDYFYRASN